MKLSHYPTLTKAFDLMLLDVVSNPALTSTIRAKVHEMSLEPVGVFDRADAELAKLNVLTLDQVCGGYIEDDVMISLDAQEVLVSLFEMIYI